MRRNGWRGIAVLVGVLAALAAPRGPGAALAQGPARDAPQARLTLEEVLALARERNPRLAAARSMVEATAARESWAGLLPDLVLQVGVMNFSLPEVAANMPTSMAPSIQAMQMLPFPGKLALSGRIAEQSTAVVRAEAEEMWWEVRTQVAMAFYEIYAADRQIEVMRRTLDLLRDFEQVARAMYSAGTGRQSDVLRASVEVARMDADITRMAAMREAMAARLNGLLDRPADTPVPSPVLGPLPEGVPPADTLREWAEAYRPAVTRGRVGVERARSTLALARRELWPDLTVGFQYGQRSGAMGTERMGSAMVGFSVPVFASRRQLRMRDEAAAMERAARADLTDLRAEVRARIGELLAELERSRTLVALYRREVLPQARANVESAFSAYRVGLVDFLTLVDAQMTVNRYEGELYALLAEYGQGVAELEMTVGRELPRDGSLVTEEQER